MNKKDKKQALVLGAFSFIFLFAFVVMVFNVSVQSKADILLKDTEKYMEDRYGHTYYEVFGDIYDSAVHDYRVFSPVRSDSTYETEEPETEWQVTREAIIKYAEENYDVSEEWVVWLIGTTHNEGYQQDRYLEYAWACEILNCYRLWSVLQLDGIWGEYYSYENACAGYWAADYTTLQMVWYAMVDLDPRIVEVDGMIRWDVPGYYLIYDSDIYNCQVWGE